MPAGIGYAGRAARRASGRASRRVNIPRTVGRSSGGLAPPMASARRIGNVFQPPRIPTAGLMSRRAYRGQQLKKAVFSKKGAAGLGIGMGAMAISRNTGNAVDSQRGRPTGIYKY